MESGVEGGLIFIIRFFLRQIDPFHFFLFFSFCSITFPPTPLTSPHHPSRTPTIDHYLWPPYLYSSLNPSFIQVSTLFLPKVLPATVLTKSKRFNIVKASSLSLRLSSPVVKQTFGRFSFNLKGGIAARSRRPSSCCFYDRLLKHNRSKKQKKLKCRANSLLFHLAASVLQPF